MNNNKETNMLEFIVKFWVRCLTTYYGQMWHKSNPFRNVLTANRWWLFEHWIYDEPSLTQIILLTRALNQWDHTQTDNITMEKRWKILPWQFAFSHTWPSHYHATPMHFRFNSGSSIQIILKNRKKSAKA